MNMSDPNPIALLIEDEPQIRRFVRMALEEEKWQVFEAETMRRGLIESGTRKPNLVIVDLGLPDGDGIEFIRDVRKWSAVPIIVLSARLDETDKIRALDAGADDYLTKPFEMSELLARLEALLRRAPSAPDPVVSSDLYQFGPVRVNFRRAEVEFSGKTIELSALEFRLLRYFIEHRGATISRDELLNEVWGYNALVSTRTVDVHVAWLRQKIETNPRHPEFVLTVHGMGYKFVG